MCKLAINSRDTLETLVKKTSRVLILEGISPAVSRKGAQEVVHSFKSDLIHRWAVARSVTTGPLVDRGSFTKKIVPAPEVCSTVTRPP